jgi:dTDP-4-amino-4,6-dideoxygalactose transaminase
VTHDSKGLAPWPVYSQDEVDAVVSVLESGKGNYWSGPKGKEFEAEFAKHCQCSHAIALANGTLALELALEAAGIGPGDDVIVTPRSFIASVSCVVRRGARPVFADVCPDSQNITPDSVREVLTPDTRAIVAVHHAGWPCAMDGLMEIADQHDLVVIEDCAQAHGARYKGAPIGGLGHIGVFSFCHDKIITTGGEGGMLVTSDDDIWRRAWSVKDHGKSYDEVHRADHPPGFRWLHETFGTNMRMTEMQAAIGLAQLEKLDDWSTRRSTNAAAIAEVLGRYPSVRVPAPPDGVKHACYRLYAFVVEEQLADGWSRDRIITTLIDKAVPGLSGACPEIYDEKAFDSGDLRPQGRLPVAHELGRTSLAFLVHPTLTEADLGRIRHVLDQVISDATK